MRLSIIIVNWNQREMLKDCLHTVFENTDPNTDEVFVVDNGSEDGSADYVAEHFPNVRLIRNAENRGFAAANNQAMKLARGGHILLLNNDTLVHGDVLARSCEYLDQNPGVAAMGCSFLFWV